MTDELHGFGALRVDVCEGVSEVALAMSTISRHACGSFWHADDRFEVRLRLAHPVWCRVNGSCATWDMERAGSPFLPLALPERGPFSAALEWALHQLDPATRNAHRSEEAVAAEAPWRSVLLRSANEVTDRALAMCDPIPLALASRFHGDVRLFVYDAMIRDSSPRTEQMVNVCPGLFVLASEHRDCETLEGIRRGHRLPSLIRAVVPRFADDRAALVLTRRATIDTSAACLRAVMHAEGVDINDIPNTHEARRLWYAAVAESQRLQRLLPRMDRQRFGSFVSKYATELAAIAVERYLDVEIVLTEIVDWIIHGHGTVPSRSSALRRVLEAVETWHLGLWTGLALDPETPLPTAPLPTSNIAGISVQPMKTVGELATEGEVMRHCVGGYANAAVEGRVYVYRGRIRRQRVTIAVSRVGDRWHLVDAAGAANRPIEEPDLLRYWIDALHTDTPRTSP